MELPVADIDLHIIQYHFLFQGGNVSSVAFLNGNNSIKADIFSFALGVYYLVTPVSISGLKREGTWFCNVLVGE